MARACAGLLLWFSILLIGLMYGAAAQEPAAQDQAAKQTANPTLPPLSIGVLISSDSDRCYDAGVIKAIRKFTLEEAASINRNGGILGRMVELKIYDDREVVSDTIDFLKQMMSDKSMIGAVGIGSSTRGNQVFAKVGSELGASGLPLVTDISLSQIYAPYPNVFSIASAVDDELAVVRRWLQDQGFTRPAFIGIEGDLYSSSLGDGLARPDSRPVLSADRRVTVVNYQIAPEEIGPTVAAIKEANADIAILAIHSGPGAEVLRAMIRENVNIPVFVLYGRIATIIGYSDKLPADLRFYQLGRDGVPYVYNERLRQLIWQTGSAGWIFEDTPNLENKAGWAPDTGKCEPKRDQSKRRIFEGGNKRAIGRGMQYRDVMHLIAELARSAPVDSDVAALRKHVVTGLTRLREGKKVYKGIWQDWTFTEGRAAAGDILITTSGSDAKTAALAPIQYRRVNASLVRSPIVDMSIDLIRLAQVDSNERRFDAEFYLSLRSAGNNVGIEAIDFTNAARSQTGRERLIVKREIHDGAQGSKFPAGVRVYKVSGTFHFNPELDTYPFDTQRLSISFQAANASTPLLIQPLAHHLRQSGGELDGWMLQDQYVGSEQDIISTISIDGVGRHVVPIYKFNQTWVARRISIDYYIRVVVPLMFILLVTYFSVYLSSTRFDSTVAIQVTALLSSIALYLALPKVDSDQATLSDKMFILTYAAVAMMIGLTVFKDSSWFKPFPGIRLVLTGIQRIAFPACTVLIVLYLISSADRDGGSILQSLNDLWAAFVG